MSLFFSDWNGTHKVLCQQRNVFKTIFAPERMKVINELISLEDDIQKEARIQKIGFVTYSSVGIVGGDLIIAGHNCGSLYLWEVSCFVCRRRCCYQLLWCCRSHTQSYCERKYTMSKKHSLSEEIV